MTVTLERLREALDRAAELALIDEVYLPIFERLDAEVSRMEETIDASPVEKARARLKARQAA